MPLGDEEHVIYKVRSPRLMVCSCFWWTKALLCSWKEGGKAVRRTFWNGTLSTWAKEGSEFI